jgi:hypothetical protein
LGEFGALFNPGMRHELEERRAKQMLREEEGSARKGRLGIDLDSGVAVIATRRDRNGDLGDDAAHPDGADADRQAREPDETDARGDGTPDADGKQAGGDGASSDSRSRGGQAGGDGASSDSRSRGGQADGDGASDDSQSRGDGPGATPARHPARPATAVPSGKARRAAGGSSPQRSR